MSDLLTTEELMRWTGERDPEALKRLLTKRRIRWTDGTQGPITTQAAVDAAILAPEEWEPPRLPDVLKRTPDPTESPPTGG